MLYETSSKTKALILNLNLVLLKMYADSETSAKRALVKIHKPWIEIITCHITCDFVVVILFRPFVKINEHVV